MKSALGFVLLAMFVQSGFASSARAEQLTLDDCIELALKNRASIIAARGRETTAGMDKLNALGAFLPQVRASYSYNKGRQFGIDPPNRIFDDTGKVIGFSDEQDIGPDKRYSVDASISVFNLSNWLNYFGARASKKAAHLDVISSEQDLILAVKTSYYAYLASAQNVDVQQQAVDRSQEQLKLIQSKFDLGSAAKSDVLKQKVRLGNDKLEQLRATNAVITTRATLAWTIGVDPNTDMQFDTSYISREYSGGLDAAVNFGLEHEPGLLSARAELDASNLGVHSRLADYLPTVSVFGSYSDFSGTQAFPSVFDYSFKNRNFGFSVSLNIFDGFSRERNLSRARVTRNNAHALLADTRNQVSRDIKTAFYDIEQQREAMLVSQENVDAAQEDLNITQEKYNLGAATILDLLDAQVSLKQAQVSLIRVAFDLNLAIAQLEQAMGKM
ncbi:MAG: TolC family protein [Candidatus Zixiibacteriota bacterium]